MNRKYLPASIVVLIVSVAMILIPQSIEMHIAPELVTFWVDTVTTENVFNFNTGSQEIDDMSPYMEVWSDDIVTLNTTFALIEDGTPTFIRNITDNPVQFYIPSEEDIQVDVTGNTVENKGATVNAALYALRPLPPEYITWYPYRFFGYGMAAIGAIASIVLYLRKDE
jgi:hypothetical protein